MMKARLKTIAELVEKMDRCIDIGTDHGYLSIYLVRNSLCASIIATDIHQNALANAAKNIKSAQLEEKIPLYLTDGLEKVDSKAYDTVLISGMGAFTIMHILRDLKEKKHIKKLILQSNNNVEELRRFIISQGFYMKEEKAVLERKKWYVVISFERGVQTLTDMEYKFGKKLLKNESYKKALINQYRHLYPSITGEKRKAFEQALAYLTKN